MASCDLKFKTPLAEAFLNMSQHESRESKKFVFFLGSFKSVSACPLSDVWWKTSLVNLTMQCDTWPLSQDKRITTITVNLDVIVLPFAQLVASTDSCVECEQEKLPKARGAYV